MKKLIVLFSFSFMVFVLSPGLKAQVELENTYVGDIAYFGDFYAYINDNTLKVYNTDHSLFKSIPINLSEYGSIIMISHTGSKHLFNADDKYEFVVTLHSGVNVYTVAVINEDGTVLQIFDSLGFPSFFNVNGSGKMILRDHTTTPIVARVYSLGGVVGVKDYQSGGESLGSSYPNPASEVITIPYKLEQGQSSVMQIYNSNGQLIRTMDIDATFNNIQLNVSGYRSGVYYYKVGDLAKSFVVY